MASIAAERPCAFCHAQIAQSYLRTGMGRSFAQASAVPLLAEFYHAPSDRYYAVVQRDGRYWMRRWQRGGENAVEKQIHYVIGSGNHSRTYVHQAPDGRLLELPVSWYRGNGGHWAMSPGYEGPDHQDFRRRISDECLFCHNGYPRADGGLAEGIDCQRCHGPGDEHARTASPRAIVNPARLGLDRQMEICMQCHLETTSRPLPNAIRRYDRAPFSYRSGEPLENFILHFDHAPGTGHDEKFEVNSSVYRLRKSKCRPLACTTCHNPHDIPRGEQARRRYDQACRTCHAATHEAATANCAGCHMPKRPSEDATHVMMTDHFIQRRPPVGGLVKSASYRGKVELYYPPQLPQTAENRLYLADAQVKEFSNLEAGIPLLEKAIAEARPAQGEFYLDLAEAYWRSGQLVKAVHYYEQAIRRKPSLAKAYSNLGEVLLRLGQPARAIAVLEKAPHDAEVANTLGVAYGQAGRIEDSLRMLSKAVELNPDLPFAWLNLGVALEHKGDLAAARSAYRTALLIQPDFAEARQRR